MDDDGVAAREASRKRITHLHWWLIGAVATLLIATCYGALVRYFVGSSEAAGQFGDMFGAFTGVLAGVAILLNAVSLYYQRRDLQATLDEMELAREQTERSAAAQEEGNRLATMKILRDGATDVAANAVILQAVLSHMISIRRLMEDTREDLPKESDLAAGLRVRVRRARPIGFQVLQPLLARATLTEESLLERLTILSAVAGKYDTLAEEFNRTAFEHNHHNRAPGDNQGAVDADLIHYRNELDIEAKVIADRCLGVTEAAQPQLGRLLEQHAVLIQRLQAVPGENAFSSPEFVALGGTPNSNVNPQ